jgi:hypothetical protein
MASPHFYANGTGGTSGGDLSTVAPFHASGDVWYVHSGTGSDAASPRGKDRSRPLATIAQAITNSTTNDTIVLLAGHSQTVAATATLLAGQNVIGEGSGSSRPSMTFSGAGAHLFTASNAGVWIDNIVMTVTGAGSTMIGISAAGHRITNCQFNCDSNAAAGLFFANTSANNTVVENCTFTSSGTSFATQGASGLLISAAITDLFLKNVVFEGGTYAWSDYALKGSAAVTRFRGINVDFLNDSDGIFATSTVGLIHIRNDSGNVRFQWTA